MEEANRNARNAPGRIKGAIVSEEFSDELIHPINIDGPVRGFVVSRRLSTPRKNHAGK
jgi:hypothetical protein